MLVTCLMPTFNRFPELSYLVEEAVECFLRQDYAERELLICNDTPGQRMVFDDPRVKVFNLDERLPDLSAKIQYMLDRAQGDAFCRWDDDDIHLPHRLSYSVQKLGSERQEWRPENYFFDVGTLRHVVGPANTHVMAIFTRPCLDLIGGYPKKYSGYEDQAFNKAIEEQGLGGRGEVLELQDVFYFYRWSTGSHHLSGPGGPPASLQSHYNLLGGHPIERGTFHLRPRWYRNHVERARQAVRLPKNPRPSNTIAGHFDYEALYEHAVSRAPRHGRLVEIGCFKGCSLVSLANIAKRHGKRLSVFGVDLGLGDGLGSEAPQDFGDSGTLLANLREAGVQDIVTVVAGESSSASLAFADDSLDVVFIDGTHDYSDVRTDLQCWWPKVKRGGLIAGHDYVNPHFPGVARAVDEFFNAERFALRSEYSSSCWQKAK